jgi:hypothetical protein
MAALAEALLRRYVGPALQAGADTSSCSGPPLVAESLPGVLGISLHAVTVTSGLLSCREVRQRQRHEQALEDHPQSDADAGAANMTPFAFATDKLLEADGNVKDSPVNSREQPGRWQCLLTSQVEKVLHHRVRRRHRHRSGRVAAAGRDPY